MASKRHIVFVTGTRAELGLMVRTLGMIRAHPKLKLSVVATGMHLDTRAGPKLSALGAAGITPAATVPWPRRDDPRELAEVTGLATARLAKIYRELAADLVLVVGDRVEAFAAAAAAHIARIPLAHVHGGDRAEGQVDDALRHAITQLAHLHLAATQNAADRIIRLGQFPATIHVVGAPGVEAVTQEAASVAKVEDAFGDVSSAAVVLLHPTTPDEAAEEARAMRLLRTIAGSGMKRTLLLAPNNDPGAEGIHRAWRAWVQRSAGVGATSAGTTLLRDVPRPLFLGLLRGCRLLAGNSSAGVIEAASFGTPVLNIGRRQHGRLCGANVRSVPFNAAEIRAGIEAILAVPRQGKGANPYYRPGTARRIAALLAGSKLAFPAPAKLLSY